MNNGINRINVKRAIDAIRSHVDAVEGMLELYLDECTTNDEVLEFLKKAPRGLSISELAKRSNKSYSAITNFVRNCPEVAYFKSEISGQRVVRLKDSTKDRPISLEKGEIKHYEVTKDLTYRDKFLSKGTILKLDTIRDAVFFFACQDNLTEVKI